MGSNFGNLRIVKQTDDAAKAVAKEVAEKATTKRISGKNPPINKSRQLLHTDGRAGKSQFKDNIDVDKLVEDAWHTGTPQFNTNGDFIGKVKKYKDALGQNGEKSIDVRFNRKKGIHGWPSNKVE